MYNKVIEAKIKRHYKNILCKMENTGFRLSSVFLFIALQNEEDYERKESSSA